MFTAEKEWEYKIKKLFRIVEFFFSLAKNKKVLRIAGQEQQTLWNGDLKVWYSGRGWKWLRHRVEVDPRDGRKKLRVTARMKKPDRLGGIVVVDYIVRTSTPPPAHK